MLLKVTAGLAAVVVAIALWAFQPWRAFTSSEVVEAAPSSDPVTASVAPSPPAPPESQSESPAPSATPTPRDEVLARGRFEDAEHATSGTVKILALADGRRFVRLEGLATSDGPDLHVWLSDAPSGGDWGSYDDGRSVALGKLRATHGDHNYEIPAGAKLAGLRSVVIWCDRFDVAFGSAPVRLG